MFGYSQCFSEYIGSSVHFGRAFPPWFGFRFQDVFWKFIVAAEIVFLGLSLAFLRQQQTCRDDKGCKAEGTALLSLYY